MTQIQMAQQGKITAEMEVVSKQEKMEAEKSWIGGNRFS